MTHDVLVLLASGSAIWPPSVTLSMASVLTRTCGSLLISSLLLSCRRYYKETSGLMLDVGGYMKALEVPAMVCPMSSSGLLEKREHFTYKKPFMGLERWLRG